MDNQMDMFSKSEDKADIQHENTFLEKIMPVLRKASEERNAQPDDITAENLKGYSSIKFRTSLIARVKLRGKRWFISIPDRLADAIPEGLPTTRTATAKKYLRISYEDLSESAFIDLLRNAALLAIERVPKEFDCCSRYEECSNARVCVHPDPGFSMLCGYRRILKDGKVFYGVNRNID